jgi:aldehyde dehydrogenase (NAD+)
LPSSLFSLELGGKSPSIIFPDTDLQLAARKAINGVFFDSWQVSAAGKRIFVQKDIYKDFVSELTQVNARMTTGNPLDHKIMLGPVVSLEQLTE